MNEFDPPPPPPSWPNIDESFPQVAPPPPRQPMHLWFWAMIPITVMLIVAMLVNEPILQAMGMAEHKDFDTLSEAIMKVGAIGIAILSFLPLVILATLGRRTPIWRPFAILYWLGLFGFVWLNEIFTAALALIDLDVFKKPNLEGQELLDSLPPGAIQTIVVIGLLCVGAIAASLLCFAPPIRRLAARLLPMDAESFPDATALATVVGLFICSIIPTLVLRGPPILLAMKVQTDLSVFSSNSLDLYVQLFWTIPLVIVAAGFPLYRRFVPSLERLGLVWPTWQQWLLIPIVTLALVGVMEYLVGPGIKSLWESCGWPTTDEGQFMKLMKAVINPWGAVAIGVVAGFSEELVFRGVFQPRLGILLSNLLFTAVHAAQYGFDALLSVFIIGLILGLIRKHSNTTTAACVHGLFDFVLVYMAYLETLKHG